MDFAILKRIEVLLALAVVAVGSAATTFVLARPSALEVAACGACEAKLRAAYREAELLVEGIPVDRAEAEEFRSRRDAEEYQHRSYGVEDLRRE